MSGETRTRAAPQASRRSATEQGADRTARHEVSAREAYLRAAAYFRTAYAPFLAPARDDRLTANSAAEHEALQRAVALWEPAAEWLEIPFEGASLPGVFIRARGAETGEPRPTVVYTNGYDGTLAEMFVAHAPAAYERGYHVLLYDGPGQGRPLIRDGLTMRPDWETVVAAAIDHALARPDVAPDAIVLSGWSFGGFLAPRAAGREHRIAALVADPGQWDQRRGVPPMLPLSDADKAAFPDIDPSALDPLAARLDSPDADPMLVWHPSTSLAPRAPAAIARAPAAASTTSASTTGSTTRSPPLAEQDAQDWSVLQRAAATTPASAFTDAAPSRLIAPRAESSR